MSDYLDKQYEDEIRTENALPLTPEQERLASNKEAVEGLKHAGKPDCDPKALRIRLIYSKVVTRVSYWNGERHERIKTINDCSAVFDTMQEAEKFLSVEGRKWQAIYWFEDTTVDIVAEIKKQRPTAIKTRRHLFSTAGNMVR